MSSTVDKLPNFTLEESETILQKFVELIRFPTISGNGPLDGSYDACAEFLVNELNAIGVPASILPESLPHKPVVVGEWLGSNPELPAILLNSHYDVVPVVADAWHYPAFEGVREQGRVYGRGTQDMKCVCMQYLIALGRLKQAGFQPFRTILITYVPDEEIGGADGMNILIQSQWFQSKQVDLALDEGLASTDDSFSIFYGERLPWWVKVQANGNTGHGSRFIEPTAVEQVIGVVNKALEFRKQQKDILHGVGNHAGCSHAVLKKRAATLGDVTTLNVTMLRAGVQAGGKDVLNVVPPTAEAGFDIRISPHTDPKEIAETITTWCKEVECQTTGLTSSPGLGLTWSFINDPLYCHSTTATTSESNAWWGVMTTLLSDELGIELVPQIFPAATDSRFLRALGLKAFGFSPMRRSPILLHEHDEYIEESVFLEGCKVYVRLIDRLASQPNLS
jgi:aminoacylase